MGARAGFQAFRGQKAAPDARRTEPGPEPLTLIERVCSLHRAWGGWPSGRARRERAERRPQATADAAAEHTRPAEAGIVACSEGLRSSGRSYRQTELSGPGQRLHLVAPVLLLLAEHVARLRFESGASLPIIGRVTGTPGTISSETPRWEDLQWPRLPLGHRGSARR